MCIVTRNILSKTNGMHVFCFTGLHSFPFHSAFALNFLSVAQNNSTLSFLPNILSLFLFTLPLSLSIFCIPLHVHNVLCYMPLSFATQITLSLITYIHFISLLLALAPKSFTGDSITPHFLQFCICICLCLHIVSLSCLHCQYLFVNMDQDKKERLSRLQMEDLGTARREHISTTDSRKVKKARLEDIEATRLSNQPGTEAQRLAEQNRQQLTEWKNVFQKLGDTDDLENLDELLNGQSHRLQLRAALHGSGSYDSGRSLKATDDYPKPSEALLSASTRGSRSRGRGGGIAGTRGRGDIRAVTVRLPSGTSNRASASKPGHHVQQASGARKASLDPALEINNSDPYGKGRGKQAQNQPPYQFGKNRGSDERSQVSTVVKTRRPITVNLPRLLSPPECFLEEARKLLQRVSETAPATTQNESNLPSAPSTASPRENRMEQPITTQKALLSNTKAVASHDEPASVTTLTIAPHENPEPQLSAAQVTADRVIKDNLSENAESTIVISKTTRKDQSASESVLKTPEESLLDLSSTPPTKDSFMRDDNLIMSPSLQELEGLEFMQSLTNTPGSTSSPIVQRPECEEPLKSTAFEEKSSATTQADEDGACDKFQRDIEMLCPVNKMIRKTGAPDDQLQQSVHAPKENKTPVTRSTGQALGGLQASIYAIREENKPIR
ncbi:unnamed protein product [Aspergillus oryzae RIB40]|uniref:DNA, SC023 n=1 Tax=Aspergillus oryzae (strain ATCC 42149 / RIB 40) TaxID=510516 RepID=Q2UGC9_ASPOR|nr:unnamed protein product [Aspergillus oryzae RIB40]BAE59386.1 unnamed protein product [Aspergillus oryzae RIB40]